jgi:hypothetical protein
MAAAANALVPFTVSVPEGDRADLAAALRGEGVTVDTSWEAQRLLDLARTAQSRNRYYGLEGGDVRSYALRLAEMDPESVEAPALLRKVAEHMAWDAESAIAEGTPEDAADLIGSCLDLVPGYPRCEQVSQTLAAEASAGA